MRRLREFLRELFGLVALERARKLYQAWQTEQQLAADRILRQQIAIAFEEGRRSALFDTFSPHPVERPDLEHSQPMDQVINWSVGPGQRVMILLRDQGELPMPWELAVGLAATIMAFYHPTKSYGEAPPAVRDWIDEIEKSVGAQMDDLAGELKREEGMSE